MYPADYQKSKRRLLMYLFFNDAEPMTAEDLHHLLGISKRMVFIHLKRLINDGHIEKIALWPKNLYKIYESTPYKTQDYYKLLTTPTPDI